jgi:tRNA threonylcarbamoyladenosine biosynthesis protein TsaB
MLTLAIDSCAKYCAVAIHDDGSDAVLGEISEDIGRGHAERLMPMIGEVAGQAGVAIAEIGQICAIAGPGSFTGIRVGLAAARGLALGLGVKAYGADRLAALYRAAVAESARDRGLGVIVVVEAGRGDFCYAGFGADTAFPVGLFITRDHELSALLAEPAACGLALCGSGAAPFGAGGDRLVLHTLTSPPIGQFARDCARLPGIRLSPEPIYFRPADAKPQSGFAVARI